MLFFRRTYVLPQEKDWHLRFVGHVDDLYELEEVLHAILGVLNPVVYDDRKHEDQLDLYLDWDQNGEEALVALAPKLAELSVTIEINERIREAQS